MYTVKLSEEQRQAVSQLAREDDRNTAQEARRLIDWGIERRAELPRSKH
jgi:hypothetical protein